MVHDNTNYKPLFFDKFQEFYRKFPTYSLGEILYSILSSASKNGVKIDNKTDLLSVSDSQLYTAIDKAIIKEEE